MAMHPKISKIKLDSPFYNTREFKTKPLALRAEDKDAGIRAAYFAIWGEKDTHGTVWIKGAFSKSIRERGPASSANQKIPIVWMHDLYDPIGQPVEIVEDEVGAYVRYKLDDPEAVPNSKRAASQIDSGTINGWSFGFDWVWDKLEYEEERDAVIVKEVDLFEISPVTYASIAGTHNVRTVETIEEYNTQMLQLREEVDLLLRSMPRNKKLELRHLLSEMETLQKNKPCALRQRTLRIKEPASEKVMEMGKYKLDLSKF